VALKIALPDKWEGVGQIKVVTNGLLDFDRLKIVARSLATLPWRASGLPMLARHVEMPNEYN
jgi:hypothetical protein